jgi:hypothetical protein
MNAMRVRSPPHSPFVPMHSSLSHGRDLSRLIPPPPYHLYHHRPALARPEAIRNVYRAPNRNEAGYRFQEFLRSVPSDLTPMVTAKETFQEWAREIMNYFDYPYTNAYTESANNLIKKLNKEGRSLSFEQMRFKALFSTRATRLPKFDIKTASYSKSDSFSMMTTTSVKPRKVLTQGFGVDIEELLDSL